MNILLINIENVENLEFIRFLLREEIRKYIRKDDLAAKRDGGVIAWGYLLSAADGF